MAPLETADLALADYNRVNDATNGVARYIADQVLAGEELSPFTKGIYAQNLADLDVVRTRYLEAVDGMNQAAAS